MVDSYIRRDFPGFPMDIRQPRERIRNTRGAPTYQMDMRRESDGESEKVIPRVGVGQATPLSISACASAA